MKNKKILNKIFFFIILPALISILFITGIYNAIIKPLPEGINYEGKFYYFNENDIDFIYDLTYLNNKNEIVNNINIFNEVFNLIDNAEKYILIDMFLFNPHKGKSQRNDYLPLSKELTKRLINKKSNNPDIKIDFITDPINTVYGGSSLKEIEELKKAGINVIITNLNKLRDSNPSYSAFWRLFIQWSGNSAKNGFLKHPFSSKEKNVTLRSYLKLLNFKANHRKIFVCDSSDNFVTVIMSANPHDASSFHSNVAIKITGGIYKDICFSENAVAKLTKNQSIKCSSIINNKTDNNLNKTLMVKTISEKKIRDNLISIIDNSKKKDKINIAMFYLSERKIIRSLIKAANRGTEVNIILDPNKDAFGYKKSGAPNRPVASELLKKTKNKINIRWYNTHGEQFHTKLFIYKNNKGPASVILGSSNLTRRNICNYNLELDVLIKGKKDSPLIKKIDDYFSMIWENNDSNYYTVKYNAYEDRSIIKYVIYRIQEFTGFCSY